MRYALAAAALLADAVIHLVEWLRDVFTRSPSHIGQYR